MDKDHGIKLTDVISRIRAVQSERKEKKERERFQKTMEDAMFDLQSKGRMFRDSLMTSASTSAGTKAPEVSFASIQEAVDEISAGMSSKPKPKFLSLDDLMNGRSKSYSVGFEVMKERDRSPLNFRLATDFNMNTVSLVSDPEPDCVWCREEDKAAAFDHAMKLVEK